MTTPTYYAELQKRVDYLYKALNCINGDCSDFNEITNVEMDGRNLNIYTSKGGLVPFSADVDYLFKVGTIAARDALPGQFDNKIAHAIVWVENTTGDPGNPRPNAYVYDGASLEWKPLVNVPAEGTSTRLVSGNLVWDGNLDYSTTPGLTYLINGVLIEIVNSQSISLDAAHPTLPRIDVIYVDKDGVLGKVTGTPATNPQQPVVSQLERLSLSFVTVAAGATTPGGTSNNLVYEDAAGDPTEFNPVASDPRINPSFDNSGDTIVFFNQAQSNDFIDFITLTPVQLSSFSLLLLTLQNTQSQPDSGFDLFVEFRLGGDLIGTFELFSIADRNSTDPQELILDKPTMNIDLLPDTQTFDTIRFRFESTGGQLLNMFLDTIILQENGATDPDPAVTEHNLLNNIQGGIPGEHYHFSLDQWTKLLALIFDPPTLSLSPSTIGSTVEVGDDVVINQLVTINITFANNIDQGRINIIGSDSDTPDGWVTPIPANFTIDKTVTPTNRGNTIAATAYIVDTQNATTTRNVIVPAEYAVHYFLWPDNAVEGNIIDPNNISTAELIAILNGNPSNQDYDGIVTRQLRSNNNLGTVTFSPGGILKRACVVTPVSYGTTRLAPPISPTSYLNTTTRNFDYDNNGHITSYVLTQVDDLIGGDTQYIIT